ncbi:MAG TPA: alkaline phosphatase family protein, partial [Steroidobacteraceae bacterium]|nr:alkaline phosphatase family protein [Steroidobacteraceae bacterium]
IAIGAAAAAAAQPQADHTRTPIKHLIVVVGENVSFDALFGTYSPPRPGTSIRNLRSQGIVTADGAPGPDYARAVQFEYADPSGRYTLTLQRLSAYPKLPQPRLTGVYDPVTLEPVGAIPDPRFAMLAVNGPFQITRFATYGDAFGRETGDPVHRFFQMWQQTGGTNEDLGRYAWVAVTTGRGGDTRDTTPDAPGQGGELMGFFNMLAGDAPYFRELADRYALSDNYHQPLMGGTGANFIALATGDVAVYTRDGRAAVPPARQIEDPSPAPGTVNFYVHDGYNGGSWVKCADPNEPGVGPIRALLAARHLDPNCAPDSYYLVNNYDPPFLPDGRAVELGPDRSVYPPQRMANIGTALSAAGVSWGWYSGGRSLGDIADDPLYATARRRAAASLPATASSAEIDAAAVTIARQLIYNNIGDPLTAFPAVSQTALADHLRGLDAFAADLAAHALPAVSFVVPKNLDSGHPGYSAPARYELFIRNLVAKVQADPGLWDSAAILITADEGGGYFDSGYIQPLDFFGDGPRIPLLAVSPYAPAGRIDHTYADQVSVLKFIEYNWRLAPLSNRSRDRLPNPRPSGRDPYRPANSPAIGDLTTLFEFPAGRPARR